MNKQAVLGYAATAAAASGWSLRGARYLPSSQVAAAMGTDAIADMRSEFGEAWWPDAEYEFRVQRGPVKLIVTLDAAAVEDTADEHARELLDRTFEELRE